MKTRKKMTLAGALLLGVAATPAEAGPNFIEGMCTNGDAGSSPAAACGVQGMGAVAMISGSTSQALGPGGTADFEDLYLIFISDPKMFSAAVGPATGFDTQLWLFRAEPGDPSTDGLGLLANDDASAVDPGAMLGPMSDDGTGIALMTPGLYYLAITGGGGSGVPDPGRFPVAMGLPIFELIDPTEISGPDGPGGKDVLDGWMGEGETGSYDIALEGVIFIEPPCPWDCEPVPDGNVGIVDFLTLLAQWGALGESCDFDGSGVGIVDFLKLLANWGPCP